MRSFKIKKKVIACQIWKGMNKVIKLISKAAQNNGLQGRLANDSTCKTCTLTLLNSDVSVNYVAQLSDCHNIKSFDSFNIKSFCLLNGVSSQQILSPTHSPRAIMSVNHIIFSYSEWLTGTKLEVLL